MRKIREVPLIVLALTLASASVALAEQSAGVFQNMEAVSGKRILVLKDGRRFDVDKRAWSRYGQALDALKPGDPFDFAYTGGRLVSIGKGADGEAAKIDSERKIRWTGRFKSQKGKWLLLQNGRQEQISQAAIFDNPKKALSH